MDLINVPANTLAFAKVMTTVLTIKIEDASGFYKRKRVPCNPITNYF
jgi:hypothetical protein